MTYDTLNHWEQSRDTRPGCGHVPSIGPKGPVPARKRVMKVRL